MNILIASHKYNLKWTEENYFKKISESMTLSVESKSQINLSHDINFYKFITSTCNSPFHNKNT